MSEIQNLDLSDSAGDCISDMVDSQPMNDSPRQHEMLASTSPRKRLILDWDPVLKRISAQVVVRNRSQESFAFKYEADCGLIVATPDCGILMPGEQIAMSLLLDEECESKREFKLDCFELLIAPFHSDLLSDDVDVEQFVHALFPDNVPLEKHVLMPMLSNVAKERLDVVAAEKDAAKQQDEEVQNLKQILYPTIGVLITLLVIYVLVAEFCHPLSLPPPERPRRL